MGEINYLRKAPYVILSLFAFFLPISDKISTLFIIATLLFCFFNYRIRYFAIIKNSIFLILLYFIYVIAYARDDVGFGFHWFETKASFIVFPLIFYFLPIDREQFIKMLTFFVLGCIVSYFICLLHPFIYNFDWSEMAFRPLRGLDPASLPIKNENYAWLNYFLSIAFNNTIDRAYLACYTVFSLAFLAIYNAKFSKEVLFGLVFFLLLALLQISSMSGLLSLSLIPLLGFFYFKKVKIKMISIGFYILMFSAFYITGQRLQEYYVEVASFIKGDRTDYDTILNDRIAFWKSAARVYEQNPVLGNGIKNAQKLMNREQSEILGWSGQWVDTINFNAHNLYLQFLIETGWIGLTVYVMAIVWFLFQIKNSEKTVKFLGLFFILIFSLHALSESMFNRYVGIAFFSFFYSLILAYDSTSINRDIK